MSWACCGVASKWEWIFSGILLSMLWAPSHPSHNPHTSLWPSLQLLWLRGLFLATNPSPLLRIWQCLHRNQCLWSSLEVQLKVLRWGFPTRWGIREFEEMGWRGNGGNYLFLPAIYQGSKTAECQESKLERFNSWLFGSPLIVQLYSNITDAPSMWPL